MVFKVDDQFATEYGVFLVPGYIHPPSSIAVVLVFKYADLPFVGWWVAFLLCVASQTGLLR